METEKFYCRLCHYSCENSVFMIDIREQTEYSTKITQFLHLRVFEIETISKSICFHCSQSLDLFNCFFEKVCFEEILYTY
jgi:hypothetical protein